MSGFFILRKLAEGPATEVFLVHLGGAPERRVAEALRTELTDQEELVGRFQGEAQLRLREPTPGMMPWTEVGTGPHERPFVLSAPLPKDNLRTRLMKKGPLPLEGALELTLSLCRTLIARGSAAYARLSPEWIFLTDDGDFAHPLVLEFGLTLSPVAQARMPAWLPPEYRSPEVIKGEVLSESVDVYSLGLILYEALTGASPVRGLTPEETIGRQLDREAPRLPERLAQVSVLVAKCLAKKPSERWESKAALEEALVRSLAGAQLRATSRKWLEDDAPAGEPEVRSSTVGLATADPPPPPKRERRSEPGRARWMMAALGACLVWMTAAVPRHRAPLEAEETSRALVAPREALTLRSYWQDCLDEAPRAAAKLLHLRQPMTDWMSAQGAHTSTDKWAPEDAPPRCALRAGLLLGPYGQGHRPKPRLHSEAGPAPRIP